MARTAKNTKIDSPTSRGKLVSNKSGYWVTVSKGFSLGYRKGVTSGRWVARIISDGKRHETFIGEADDILDANGIDVFTYAQAQTKARSWQNRMINGHGAENGKGLEALTVADAATDYLKDYESGKTKGGGKALRDLQNNIKTFVLPELGNIKLSKLTKQKIETWRDAIVNSPPRRRSKFGSEPRFDLVQVDKDYIRRRRASGNRVLTVLKAILNNTYSKYSIGNKEAWTNVKAFREVSAPKIRWLTDEEARRLTNAAPAEVKRLIVAALLTGARYGELTALRVSDFNLKNKSIFIEMSKSGKSRHVHLTDEGVSLFKSLTVGRKSGERVFIRANGSVWQKSDQFRYMKAGCEAARIEPAIGFHILRHTYASRLAMRSVSMSVIAAQLGHSDTRMTEKHYAHLGPSYVAQVVRDAFDDMELITETNNLVSFNN